MNCLENGEIIEDYPHPSCLVYGNSLNGQALHVVVGCNDETLFMITAYYPNTDKFEADLKTRKRR